MASIPPEPRPEADSPLAEDADLLVTQARRCRDILKRLGEVQEASDERHDRIEFLAALEEASVPLRGLGPVVTVELSETGDGDAPVLRRIPELLYGIGNFIENMTKLVCI
mgnify:CR=1 FL=1